MPDGRFRAPHIAPLQAVQTVQTSLELFRSRIPLPFRDVPNHSPHSPLSTETYDGLADPWWLLCHMNLYTAEMLMWREMAHHRKQAYETAVSCARAVVGLVRRMRPDSWIHLGQYFRV